MTRTKSKYEIEAEHIGNILIASGGERRHFHAAIADFLQQRDRLAERDNDARHSKSYSEAFEEGRKVGYADASLDAAVTTNVEIALRVNGQEFEPMQIAGQGDGSYRLSEFRPNDGPDDDDICPGCVDCDPPQTLGPFGGAVQQPEADLNRVDWVQDLLDRINRADRSEPQPEVLDLRTPRPQDVRKPNPLELPDAMADLQKATEHFRDSTGYFAQVFVGPTEQSVRFGIRACAEVINQIEPEGHA